MTGAEAKAIRERLSEACGVRLSQQDLGIALGLSQGNAPRAIREWETSGPTGPGAVALRLLLYCVDAGHIDVVREIITPRAPGRD